MICVFPPTDKNVCPPEIGEEFLFEPEGDERVYKAAASRIYVDRHVAAGLPAFLIIMRMMFSC